MASQRHNHGSLSDSDRFSAGDLSGEPVGAQRSRRRNSGAHGAPGGATGAAAGPAASAVVDVPTGLHREMATSHVRKVSAELPGFRDWRTASESSPKSVGDNLNQPSSQRNIQDIESDVLAALPAKARDPSKKLARRGPKRRRHPRGPSKELASHGSDKSSLPSVPTVHSGMTGNSLRTEHSGMTGNSLLTEDDPSFVSGDSSMATGATERVCNTARANMHKYKKLYEAMLEEVERENTKESKWTSLPAVGEGSHETSPHGSFRASGLGTGAGRGLDVVQEHNGSFTGKGAFRDGGSSGSGNGDGAENAKKAKAKRGRRSKHKESKDGADVDAEVPAEEDTGRGGAPGITSEALAMLQPHAPTMMILDDASTIDGLKVQEVLLDGAPAEGAGGFDLRGVAPTTAKSVEKETVDTDNLDTSEESPDLARKGSSNRSFYSAFADGCEATKKPSQKQSRRGSLRSSGSSKKSSHGESFRSSGSSSHRERSRRSRRKARKSRSPSADRRKSPGRSRKDRSRSRGPSSEGSVGSHRSSRSSRSNRSDKSRDRSRSRRKRRPSDASEGQASGASGYAADADGPAKVDAVDETKPKKGLFRTIKKLAGKVKTLTLGEGVHKYKIGEVARYRVVGRAPRGLGELYDPETNTVEVEVVAVHVDAVLEMPYYTIRLPDDSRKQTSWDNLIPLSEFRKCHVGDADADQAERGRERGRSARRLSFRSLSRGRSASRPRERSDSVCSHRSSGSRRISFSLDEADDERSVASHRSGASHRSSRSSSSRQSTRSSSSRRSTRSTSSRKGRSRSGKSKGTRPRSPSPFSQREARSDGKRHSSRSKAREENDEDHRPSRSRRHGKSRSEHSSSMKSISSGLSKGSSSTREKRSRRKAGVVEEEF